MTAEVTARDLVEDGRHALAAAGIRDGRREALFLMAAISGQHPAAVLVGDPGEVSPADQARMRELVARRAGGEPLAYVTRSAGFRHLTLLTDERALIPRPETEGLVELALDRCREGVAADIGTGTGAIALALRQEGAFREVIGTDLSGDALALARSNAAATGLEVTWLQGDLLAPLGGRRVDLLVSNPPYLSEPDYLACDDSVRRFEPKLALVGGSDGMSILRRLFQSAPEVVVPGGWLALEVDHRRAAETARLADTRDWHNVAVHDDLFGRARYVLAQRRSEG